MSKLWMILLVMKILLELLFEKYHSFQSASNLSLHQNFSFKKSFFLFFSKRLLIFFFIFFFIFKFNFFFPKFISNFCFSKLLSILFFKIFWNSFLIFLKVFFQISFNFFYIHFQNCSLKNIFSKLISQRGHKLSIICLISFFLMHLHSFRNTWGQ